MKLWQSLYATIWLIFFVLFTGMFDPIPYHGHIHAVLGLFLVVHTVKNKLTIKKRPCPDRLKRIAGATAGISVAALLTGVLMAIPQLESYKSMFGAFHIIFAVAITAQAGSVATAYDMWGDKEFLEGDPDAPLPGSGDGAG